MTRRPHAPAARFLLTVLSLLVLAVPAWAVVVEFDVRGSSGEPVAGATIVIDGSTLGTTDSRGRAAIEVDVQPGTRREVVIRIGDRVLFRDTREIRSDITNRIAIPGRGSRPANPLTFGMGSPVFGTTVSSESVATDLAGQRFDLRTTLNGAPVTSQTQSGTQSAEALAEIDRVESKRHRVTRAFGGQVSIPLPGVGGARMAQLPASRGESSGAAASSPAPGGWRFLPAFSVGASRADLEFESTNLENPAASQVFAGNGLLWSASVGGVVFPCSGCGWFGTVGYTYSRIGDASLSRAPTLQNVAPAGAQVLQDDLRYRTWAHTTRAA